MFPTKYNLMFIDYETTGLNPNTDFPIEVGLIITNCYLDKLYTHSTLIRWEELLGYDTWPEDAWDAYKIHKIPYEEYTTYAVSPVGNIEEAVEVTQRETGARKTVLVSDNIRFEWRFTQKLFAKTDWPFHYCGWDTSLLLEMIGIGDPQNVAHRAMADVEQLYEHVKVAADILRSTNSALQNLRRLYGLA